MLKMIIAASPSLCNNCTSVFSSETASRLRCFSCDVGLCPHCVSQSELEAAKAVLKNIAPICDECMWSIDNPGRSEEPHEEPQYTIPPKPFSQSTEEDNEAMIELGEEIEIEDDIPLILDPKAATKDLIDEENMFPEDNVFENINTTIITINSQKEATIVSPILSRISPEKSKLTTSSTPKPILATKSTTDSVTKTQKINAVLSVEKNQTENLNIIPQVKQTRSNVEKISTKKLSITNTSRINIISTIPPVSDSEKINCEDATPVEKKIKKIS